MIDQINECLRRADLNAQVAERLSDDQDVRFLDVFYGYGTTGPSTVLNALNNANFFWVDPNISRIAATSEPDDGSLRIVAVTTDYITFEDMEY